MYKRRLIFLTLAVVLSIALGACCAGLQPFARPTATPQPTRTSRPTPMTEPTAAATAPPAQAPLAPANELEAQVEAVFQQAGPAVVNIVSRAVMLGAFMQPMPQEGAGSGFVYDNLGHIVTNYHVVENAESVSVAFATGDSYPAEVVGEDPSTDLAVLRVDVPDLPTPLPLADSSQLRVGQFVVAIGNPFRLGRTLTLGIISALERVIESPDGRVIAGAIQTDAAINPGNSGGPMLDLNGNVIGVNSQIISPSGAYAGIGFAVSSNTVSRIVPELIARGRFPHPWLGVTIYSLTPDSLQFLQEVGMDIQVEQGVLVLEVVSGSPAATADVRGGDRMVQFGTDTLPVGGDVITAIDGQPVATGQDVTMYLDANTQVGDTVELTVIRGGRELTIPVALGELPSQ
jgi:S1-C subfamily serine protease